MYTHVGVAIPPVAVGNCFYFDFIAHRSAVRLWPAASQPGSFNSFALPSCIGDVFI
jgi:hypothetical protein